MKIATWNVNSIRVRLEHILQWLATHQPDVLALQETKCEDHIFPEEAFKAAGYEVIFSGQKTYNGVAILSKVPAKKYEVSGYCGLHAEKRILVTEINDIFIVDVYVPNGQAVGSEKYAFKLEWLKGLVEFISSLKKQSQKIIILGDFNIAPETIDHTSANFIKDEIMISAEERAMFYQLIELGFTDSLRIFNKEPKQYTWWDYRIRAFEKNLGYRIDHILVSEALVENCQSCIVDTAPRALEKPSDHAPVMLTLLD